MSKCRFTGYAECYRYRVLDRMKQDCRYYLGNGNRAESVLWGGTVEQHIDYMREIWDSFPIDKKPEWLTMEDINTFERQMRKEVAA